MPLVHAPHRLLYTTSVCLCSFLSKRRSGRSQRDCTSSRNTTTRWERWLAGVIAMSGSCSSCRWVRVHTFSSSASASFPRLQCHCRAPAFVSQLCDTRPKALNTHHRWPAVVNKSVSCASEWKMSPAGWEWDSEAQTFGWATQPADEGLEGSAKTQEEGTCFSGYYMCYAPLFYIIHNV